MMNLDDFADYRISIGDESLLIRHNNCKENFVERVVLERPLRETNIKWLMLRATTHWQEVHENEEKG
jgi:hypothetical protein